MYHFRIIIIFLFTTISIGLWASSFGSFFKSVTGFSWDDAKNLIDGKDAGKVINTALTASNNILTIAALTAADPEGTLKDLSDSAFKTMNSLLPTEAQNTISDLPKNDLSILRHNLVKCLVLSQDANCKAIGKALDSSVKEIVMSGYATVIFNAKKLVKSKAFNIAKHLTYDAVVKCFDNTNCTTNLLTGIGECLAGSVGAGSGCEANFKIIGGIGCATGSMYFKYKTLFPGLYQPVCYSSDILRQGTSLQTTAVNCQLCSKTGTRCSGSGMEKDNKYLSITQDCDAIGKLMVNNNQDQDTAIQNKYKLFDIESPSFTSNGALRECIKGSFTQDNIDTWKKSKEIKCNLPYFLQRGSDLSINIKNYCYWAINKYDVKIINSNNKGDKFESFTLKIQDINMGINPDGTTTFPVTAALPYLSTGDKISCDVQNKDGTTVGSLKNYIQCTAADDFKTLNISCPNLTVNITNSCASILQDYDLDVTQADVKGNKHILGTLNIDDIDTEYGIGAITRDSNTMRLYTESPISCVLKNKSGAIGATAIQKNITCTTNGDFTALNISCPILNSIKLDIDKSCNDIKDDDDINIVNNSGDNPPETLYTLNSTNMTTSNNKKINYSSEGSNINCNSTTLPYLQCTTTKDNNNAPTLKISCAETAVDKMLKNTQIQISKSCDKYFKDNNITIQAYNEKGESVNIVTIKKTANSNYPFSVNPVSNNLSQSTIDDMGIKYDNNGDYKITMNLLIALSKLGKNSYKQSLYCKTAPQNTYDITCDANNLLESDNDGPATIVMSCEKNEFTGF